MFALVPNFNLVDTIEKIAMSLPVNTKLYIKPHPHWKNAEVNINEAIKIAKIKNVKFLSPN
jgi:hypothetical protein